MAMTAEQRAALPDRIRPGQIWREARSGRHVKILEEEVHGTGPAWTYCDPTGCPEPHDASTHSDWFWHYCDVLDFVVWGRFEFVREAR
jgi:hypothetical protein